MTAAIPWQWLALSWLLVLGVALSAVGWYLLRNRRLPEGTRRFRSPLARISPASLLELATDYLRGSGRVEIRRTEPYGKGVWRLLASRAEAPPGDEEILVHVIHCPPGVRIGVERLSKLRALAREREAWLITNGLCTPDAVASPVARGLQIVSGLELGQSASA